MDQKLAYYEMKGQTAIVTIDHPPMNALDVATKEAMGATEAFRLGLIERVVPPGRALEAALELSAKIIEKGPLGVAAGKKVINGARDLSLWQGLELESDLWSGLTATEDMKEGARAFIEKRKPQYRGR